MPDVHSTHGPSSAVRWMGCPGSVKLEQGLKEAPSEYAKEGTLAHSFCEAEVKHRFGLITAESYKDTIRKLKKRKLYDPEMERHSKSYSDFIYGIVGEHCGESHDIMVEHMVRYENVAPGGFGTSDCIIAFPGEVHVVDFKYGKGIAVSAVDNPQMKLYGYGAYRELNCLLDIKTVYMHIFQPRLDNYSSWNISADELRKWATEEVRIAAELTQSETPVYNPSPETCRWCKAKTKCRARADWLKQEEKSPDLLTSAEIAALLPRAKELEAWAEELTGEARQRLEAGEEVPGYKIVLGRAGNRTFTDPDLALERAKQAGIDESMLYNRVPVTLTQLESLMGKQDFYMAVGDLIERAPRKPTLVPENDKRPAYNPIASAFGLEL